MKLRIETNCHNFSWCSEYLALEVCDSSDIRDTLAQPNIPKELVMLYFSNLSFICLLLGVCRTNLVTCEAIERLSPTKTPSLAVSR